mmetsp:Transcript_2857/g.11362  ORF Transcript_2857/g.11362 Transcript_2857/m.11362 type:complete len:293 (+) Transcript_2857:418-1296(+)
MTRSMGSVSAAAAVRSDPTEKSPPDAAATTARTSCRLATAARCALALCGPLNARNPLSDGRDGCGAKSKPRVATDPATSSPTAPGSAGAPFPSVRKLASPLRSEELNPNPAIASERPAEANHAASDRYAAPVAASSTASSRRPSAKFSNRNVVARSAPKRARFRIDSGSPYLVRPRFQRACNGNGGTADPNHNALPFSVSSLVTRAGFPEVNGSRETVFLSEPLGKESLEGASWTISSCVFFGVSEAPATPPFFSSSRDAASPLAEERSVCKLCRDDFDGTDGACSSSSLLL